MPRSSPALNIPFNPWLYFLVFLAANTLLSYFQLPIELRLWVLLAGVLLPLALAFRHAPPLAKAEGELGRDEFLDSPPLGILLLVAAAAVFIRFYRLSSLSGWPLMDESDTGFFALEEGGLGSKPFFYGAAQIPPLYFWLQRLVFQGLGPSLFSLWILPALISLTFVPLSFLAFRAYFSRSLSWMATALFALGFWPFYLGRFSMPHGLLVAWEMLTLWVLGLFLKTPPGENHPGLSAGLGILVGGGFYIEFHWPLMAVLVAALVGYKTLRFSARRRGDLACFSLALVLVLAPFLFATLREKSGGYFSLLLFFHSSSTLADQVGIWWNYISGLFWGVETARHGYKPFWGGFLNPVWGAFFGLGCVELFRRRRKKEAWALGLGLVLFMLPGLLTRELEMFREVMALPFLLAIVLVGWEFCLKSLPSSKRGAWALAFLLAAVSLDFYHLLGPYQRANHFDVEALAGYSKPYERWAAWGMLEKTYREKGPGLILTELESSPFDQSLTLAAFPFNAARNPRLSPDAAKWGAFLVNINDVPFLARRFPRMNWFEPCLVEMEPKETLMLALVDLEDPEMKKAFLTWMDFDRALHPSTSRMLHLRFGGDHREILEGLLGLQTQAASDPFLETCWAERVYYNAMADNRAPLALRALRAALLKGYPAAQVYNDLGAAWSSLGEYGKAREAFQAAVKSPLDHTTAEENLLRLPSP